MSKGIATHADLHHVRAVLVLELEGKRGIYGREVLSEQSVGDQVEPGAIDFGMVSAS